MSDTDWRQALREWEAAPDDAALLRRAVAAGRRAGQSVGWLLDRDLLPPRTFRSDLPFRVLALVGAERDPDEHTWDAGARSTLGPWLEVQELGRTPGEVAIPPHRFWWVAPEGTIGKALPRILEEVATREVAGIDLSNSRVTDADLAPLASLTELRAVLLHACSRVTDDLPGSLPPGLRLLGVAGCSRLSDACLAGLARCRDLTFLDASRNKLASLDALPRGLTHLNVGWIKKLVAAHFQALGRLTELRQLVLDGTGAGRASLDALRPLAALERLDLSSNPRITDAALDALRAFPRLRALGLKLCRGVTLRGLLGLAALPDLRFLDASSLYFGEPGARSEGLTTPERDQLRAALPRTRIVF